MIEQSSNPLQLPAESASGLNGGLGMAKSYVELTWEEYEDLKSYETQLLEVLEQLNDVRDRSERYREALVQILAGENDLQCAWWQIARSALERA